MMMQQARRDIADIFPLIPVGKDDFLCLLSEPVKRKLIATYIAVTQTLGDDVCVQGDENRDTFEREILAHAVTGVNDHMKEINVRHIGGFPAFTDMSFSWEKDFKAHDELMLLNTPKDFNAVGPQKIKSGETGLYDHWAQVLLEAYQKLTPQRPATIREALNLCAVPQPGEPRRNGCDGLRLSTLARE